MRSKIVKNCGGVWGEVRNIVNRERADVGKLLTCKPLPMVHHGLSTCKASAFFETTKGKTLVKHP